MIDDEDDDEEYDAELDIVFDEGVMYYFLNKLNGKNKRISGLWDDMDDLEFDEMNDVWDELDGE